MNFLLIRFGLIQSRQLLSGGSTSIRPGQYEKCVHRSDLLHVARFFWKEIRDACMRYVPLVLQRRFSL